MLIYKADTLKQSVESIQSKESKVLRIKANDPVMPALTHFENSN